MKILIEVSGGVVCNIVATQECSIYLVDHDNIKEKGDDPTDAREAMQPDRITYEEGLDETPEFNACLDEVLSEYAPLVECGSCGGYHPAGFDGDCRDDANRFPTPDKSEPKQELIGYYDLDGYRIEDNLDGEVLYEAGNNPHESSSHVAHEHGLSLATLKEYCERTGREMAEERGATFAGAFEAAKED